MPRDIEYDFFVSYASADNRAGWVDAVVKELVDEHARFTGGRTLTYFLDRAEIRHLSHWHAEIFNRGLARSRFFLAFLSPNYFASEVCRKEWRAWIEQEISLHILTGGAAPIYFVEVPGLLSRQPEHEVAAKVAELCGFDSSVRFAADLSPVVKEARRRQLVNLVLPLKNAGVKALQEADLKATLAKLAEHIAERVEETKRADASANTVPPYNPKFTGRLDELLELRRLLTDNRAGVVVGIQGLGGIGKTELAYAFAHAYAGVYPGGRFEVRCEHFTNIRDAVTASLGGTGAFHPHISDEERKNPEAHFAAIKRVLQNRLTTLGSVLLVLDNVSDLNLLSPQETDRLTVLGPTLHLLATTRLAAGKALPGLTLGEMKPDDALALLDKFRPFASDDDRTAAESIVKQLGGFALVLELTAAKLAVAEDATYISVAEGLGLSDLDLLAEQTDVVLRRHNHEKRLQAVLGPTLAALAAEERRAMDFAALLPPDNVPLPWLEPLVTAGFPALTASADRWRAAVDRLIRLGLFTRVQEEATGTRQVRVHRLVQELLRREMSDPTKGWLQKSVDALVAARDTAMDTVTDWVTASWELAPLEGLARLWDEWGHPRRCWLLNQVANLLQHLSRFSEAEWLYRRALAIDEANPATRPEAFAVRLNNLAELLRLTNRYAEAEPLLRRALALAESAHGPDHPTVATVLNHLGILLSATNRYAEAEPLLRRAVGICEVSLPPNHPDLALTLNNLADLFFATNRYADAERLFRRALPAFEAAFGDSHPRVSMVLNNLAVLLRETGRHADAEPLLRQALAIQEQAFGPNSPNAALQTSNLGEVLYETGRHAEAEPLFRRALAIQEEALGQHHPTVALTANNLGLLCYATDRFGEAEPLIRRALAIDEASFGPDHPHVARDLGNLGLLLVATNRKADAEPILRRAVAVYEKSFGVDHPKVALALNNLGGVLRELDRLPDAVPLFRRALAISENAYGPNHTQVAVTLNNLAEALPPVDAEPIYRRALSIVVASFGREDPRAAFAMNNLAWTLEQSNRLPEAEYLYRKAAEILSRAYGPGNPNTQAVQENLDRVRQPRG